MPQPRPLNRCPHLKFLRGGQGFKETVHDEIKIIKVVFPYN